LKGKNYKSLSFLVASILVSPPHFSPPLVSLVHFSSPLVSPVEVSPILVPPLLVSPIHFSPLPVSPVDLSPILVSPLSHLYTSHLQVFHLYFSHKCSYMSHFAGVTCRYSKRAIHIVRPGSLPTAERSVVQSACTQQKLVDIIFTYPVNTNTSDFYYPSYNHPFSRQVVSYCLIISR
jgi:hypothetical protein